MTNLIGLTFLDEAAVVVGLRFVGIANRFPSSQVYSIILFGPICSGHCAASNFQSQIELANHHRWWRNNVVQPCPAVNYEFNDKPCTIFGPWFIKFALSFHKGYRNLLSRQHSKAGGSRVITVAQKGRFELNSTRSQRFMTGVSRSILFLDRNQQPTKGHCRHRHHSLPCRACALGDFYWILRSKEKPASYSGITQSRLTGADNTNTLP